MRLTHRDRIIMIDNEAVSPQFSYLVLIRYDG